MAAQVIETNIPQRLDRLPFSQWHLIMVIALGITWLLDGLELNGVPRNLVPSELGF